jgi:hypothetical protein
MVEPTGGSMAPKKTPTDREMFLASLALFDRPESELRQRPLDEDADVDAFVEAVFGNGTLPPT